MPTVYKLNYQPDVDQNWDVNPGVCSLMSGFSTDKFGNLVSIKKDYGQGFSVTGSDALHGQMFRQVSGAVRFLVFRVQNIDEYDNAGTRTNRGTGYNASTVDWSAASWGNQIIACNYLDSTQSSTGAGFAALGGGSPKARYVAANVNFVMMADVDDGGSNVYSDMVWWSAIRNPSSYTPSLATQAGNIRLLDVPGPIKQIVSWGDKFVAFKENAIFIGQYVGPPYVWSWKVATVGVGCSYPKSVVEIDGKLFFAHRTGQFLFDGTSIENVGSGVQSSISTYQQDTDGRNVRAVANDVNGTVWLCTLLTIADGSTHWQLVSHSYNARTRLWALQGAICNATATGERCTVVQSKSTDIYSFKSSLGINDGFLWLDNAASPKLSSVAANVSSDSVGTIYTGLFGSNERAGSVVRIYPRFINTSTSTPIAGASMAAFKSDSGNTEGDTLSNVALTWNNLNHTLDGIASSRFHAVYMTFTSGQYVKLAGLGVDIGGSGARA